MLTPRQTWRDWVRFCGWIQLRGKDRRAEEGSMPENYTPDKESNKDGDGCYSKNNAQRIAPQIINVGAPRMCTKAATVHRNCRNLNAAQRADQQRNRETANRSDLRKERTRFFHSPAHRVRIQHVLRLRLQQRQKAKCRIDGIRHAVRQTTVFDQLVYHPARVRSDAKDNRSDAE